jgi:hypothetical protein
MSKWKVRTCAALPFKAKGLPRYEDREEHAFRFFREAYGHVNCKITDCVAGRDTAPSHLALQVMPLPTDAFLLSRSGGACVAKWVMVELALLLVGSPMPDRSKVMTQTKRDVVVVDVGGWAWGWHSFISNLSDDRSTASSKTIPPLNAI